MNSPSVNQHRYSHSNEPSWSKSEKAIARKVFDAALDRELREVIREAKQKAGQIKEPADLWDLEHYLTQRRKEIDRKYDYRYSQLDLVFGRLLREKWIDEGDLRGLGEDKLRAIRSYAKFFAGTAPA
jgi:Photoprotection regulator fluorescence recovery protein